MTDKTPEQQAAEDRAGADAAVENYLEPYLTIVRNDLVYIVDACKDDSARLRAYLKGKMAPRDLEVAYGLMAGTDMDKRLARLGTLLSLAETLCDNIEAKRQEWYRDNDRKRRIALGILKTTKVDEVLRTFARGLKPPARVLQPAPETGGVLPAFLSKPHPHDETRPAQLPPNSFK